MTKKYLALALGALLLCGGAICFTGCKMDESDFIAGDWEVTALMADQFGSPNSSNNYCNYWTDNLSGSCDKHFIFKKDNTGKKVVSCIFRASDTSLFTYAIDGSRGVITFSDNNIDNENVSLICTIEDIQRNNLVIRCRYIEEDCHDSIGDTSHYTRTADEWYFCKKR